MNELDELFSRDPLNLTDQDLDKIVVAVRAQLAQFDLTGKSPAKGGAKKKASLDAPAKPVTEQLNLSDLGL